MLLSNFSHPVKFYSFWGGNEKFTVIGAGSLFAQPRPPCPTLSRLRRSSRGFATRLSHLAHKTQTRACSQAITLLTAAATVLEMFLIKFPFTFCESHLSNVFFFFVCLFVCFCQKFHLAIFRFDILILHDGL